MKATMCIIQNHPRKKITPENILYKTSESIKKESIGILNNLRKVGKRTLNHFVRLVQT